MTGELTVGGGEELLALAIVLAHEARSGAKSGPSKAYGGPTST